MDSAILPSLLIKHDSAARGAFINGNLYLYAVSNGGILLAHGGNPALVGTDQRNLADADGRFFTREMLEASASRDRGWIDYKWKDPTSGHVDAKSAYYELIGDMIVGCGIYKQAHLSAQQLPTKKTAAVKPVPPCRATSQAHV